MLHLLSRGSLVLTTLVALIPPLSAFAAPNVNASRVVLSSDFSPPRVFKNTNLLRTIDLTKPYERDIIAVIIENVSKAPQSEYYVPFAAENVAKVSYIEARDKKGSGGEFVVAKVDFDTASETQYYQVKFSSPLAAGEQLTLQITLGLTDVVTPIPAEIEQVDKQFLQWAGTQYVQSVYESEKQKTKLKLPNNEAPDWTKLAPKSDGTEDPTKSGAQFTYGPYAKVAAGEKGELVTIRYEYTHPVIKIDTFQRDIEISHWGGNLAIEERYWMRNVGALLKGQFNRVKWAATNYYNPPTSAIRELKYPLLVGTQDAYFTDEIGNVSTSRFRANHRESHLEFKPRYPVFGGWNYSFVVGWNHNLEDFVRVKPNGEDYVLKVPFLDGPDNAMSYDKLEVTIILPEGASNVEYTAPIVLEKEERYLHKTFMDTIGRTAIKLSATNVADEQHHKEIVVTYHLPKYAFLRKPFVFFSGLLTLFTFSWLVGKIDVRIGK